MKVSKRLNSSMLIILLMTLATVLSQPLESFSQRPGSPKAKAKTKTKAKAKSHHRNQQHKKAHAKRVAHHHYKHLPKRGVVVTTLPNGVVKVKHKSGPLHYHNGVFYKPKGAASFTIARAPVGIKVKVLPQGHKKVMVQSRPYVYYYGTFYSKSKESNEYEVVAAPVGAEVDAIPEGYEMEEIDGVVYYTLDDVKYKEKESDGEPIYEVVK